MSSFYTSYMNLSFFSQCYGNHRDLHSFPTRRSSDLVAVIKTRLDEPIIIAHRAQCLLRNREQLVEFALGKILIGHFGNERQLDRKSTRLNSSHPSISYAVFCLKKKKKQKKNT